MSMPAFPKNDPPLTREGSLNEIISSIAAEELSLSHIVIFSGESYRLTQSMNRQRPGIQ